MAKLGLNGWQTFIANARVKRAIKATQPDLADFAKLEIQREIAQIMSGEKDPEELFDKNIIDNQFEL